MIVSIVHWLCFMRKLTVFLEQSVMDATVAALYFCSAAVLGALSDKFGRKLFIIASFISLCINKRSRSRTAFIFE